MSRAIYIFDAPYPCDAVATPFTLTCKKREGRLVTLQNMLKEYGFIFYLIYTHNHTHIFFPTLSISFFFLVIKTVSANCYGTILREDEEQE